MKLLLAGLLFLVAIPLDDALGPTTIIWFHGEAQVVWSARYACVEVHTRPEERVFCYDEKERAMVEER